jgi:hypothetical protein
MNEKYFAKKHFIGIAVGLTIFAGLIGIGNSANKNSMATQAVGPAALVQSVSPVLGIATSEAPIISLTSSSAPSATPTVVVLPPPPTFAATPSSSLAPTPTLRPTSAPTIAAFVSTPPPTPAATPAQVQSTNCTIKGNISSNGHIYHMPGQRYYNATIIDTAKGERWFCSVSEAEAAGWRAAKV